MLPSKQKMEDFVSVRSCFLQTLTMLVTSARVWPTTAGEEEGSVIRHLCERASARLRRLQFMLLLTHRHAAALHKTVCFLNNNIFALKWPKSVIFFQEEE